MRINAYMKMVARLHYRAVFSRLFISFLLFIFTVNTYAESDWLIKMVSATQTLSYEGSFLYARGGNIQLMKVRHRVGTSGREERIWHINGLPMEIIRKNDILTCYHPDGASADLEHTIPSGPYSQVFLHSGLSRLPGYQIEHLGKDRVSERVADMILLMPKEADRYSYRLWLDEETHILLRSEIVDINMDILEQFQFVEIDLDPIFHPDAFEPKLAGNSLSHVEKIPASLKGVLHITTDPDWHLNWLPDGFRLSHIESMTERQSMLNYSDGVSSFSLFFEPVSLGMPEGQRSMGATWAITRHNYSYSMTFIGELPLASAERILSAVKPN